MARNLIVSIDMKTAMHANTDISINRIVIAGAGAIGNYLGVQLHEAGFYVTFLSSSRIVDAVQKFGLTLEYPNNSRDVFSPQALSFTTDARCCQHADLVIITAKRLITASLIEQIKPYLQAHSILLTLQNGITNTALLKQAFPNHVVLGGMVTFNVIEKLPSLFRLTTSGHVYVEKQLPSLLPIFQRADMVAKEHEDIEPLLWSKLLLNLINPLNALSGMTLKQNLSDRTFRQQWAACLREGLAVLKAAAIQPAKITPLPLHWLPFTLSLPNWIYLLLAKNMSDMDATARSSMAQDLAKGKATEIDYLSGELVQLGKKVGVHTPLNDKVYAAMKQKEAMLLTESISQ